MKGTLDFASKERILSALCALFLFEEITVYSAAGKELEELALEVGFANSKHFEIGGGLMGNLVATR